jgi:putative protease
MFGPMAEGQENLEISSGSNLKGRGFELLLPVGQLEMALAAIHNGADAIYVGFPQFNARGRSSDLTFEELKNLIETCHLYGVKVNLALNIVIFENELASIVQALQKILPLNPDALIIQDLGLLRLIRKLSPDQAIHASTQMTVTNDLAIRFLEDLKIKRFVLGRENSLTEIGLIKQKTEKELEVFVHGALCVSYSGQCFTSETLGGRSANRGQCAQSCRFGYELIVDGVPQKNLKQDYLVSPQDLCGLNEIAALMDLGVTSFKVEGRLKAPEYVASAAREYRQAMDLHLRGSALTSEESRVSQRNLATNFSRGFYPGWLHGVNHQNLVDGTFSSHRGAPIGKVLSFEKPSSIVVELAPGVVLNPGDGLLWAKGQKEWGSFVFSVDILKANRVRLGINKDIAPSFQGAALSEASDSTWSQAQLYLNHDKTYRQRLQSSFSHKEFLKRIPISVEIELVLGQPLLARVSDGRWSLEEQSQTAVAQANKHPLTDEALQSEFESLGGSVFKLEKISILRKSSDSLFLNAKEIKNLRQSLIRRLTTERMNHRIDGENWCLDSRFSFDLKAQQAQQTQKLSNEHFSKESNQVNFNVLLRAKGQVDALLTAITQGQLKVEDFNFIILDFEFGRDTQPALLSLREMGFRVGLATTRILKPQESGNLKIIAAQKPDMVLVRNLGAITFFKEETNFGGEIAGDFSLNVTNNLTAEYFLSKGLGTICLSYDLNEAQVRDILQQTQGSRVEATIHQFMPSFHMEHCVFAAFLSQGTSFRDCGNPCEKHLVQLKDQFGNIHWIKPDHECRNTMYHGQAQTALNFVDEWRELGLGAVRYEALYETSHDLVSKLQHYVNFLQGKQTLQETLQGLKLQEKYGLSEGNLSREHKYQSRKKHFLASPGASSHKVQTSINCDRRD